MAGIFVQTVAFATAATAVGLAEDMSKGLIDRFRSLPMARSAVLIGRTIADLVRNVLRRVHHVAVRARRRLAHPQRVLAGDRSRSLLLLASATR